MSVRRGVLICVMLDECIQWLVPAVSLRGVMRASLAELNATAVLAQSAFAELLSLFQYI